MKTKRKRFIKISLTLLILFILFLIYIYIEPYWLIVKRVDIIDKDIPKSFHNKTIVFIADIHNGASFSLERVRSLVEKINKLNPDIIILGGDYVSSNAKYITPCFNELRNLKATIGKFAVLGNHDHWESATLTKIKMIDAGIKLIDNTSFWVSVNEEEEESGERIKIGGVGDLWTDYQDINPTIEDTKKDDFVILTSHNPDYAEEITTYNIDLLLCGHTHGGQITLLGLYAPILPIKHKKYRTGIVKTKYTKVLITNGVGLINPPIRFFARPEIVLITLKQAIG